MQHGRQLLHRRQRLRRGRRRIGGFTPCRVRRQPLRRQPLLHGSVGGRNERRGLRARLLLLALPLQQQLMLLVLAREGGELVGYDALDVGGGGCGARSGVIATRSSSCFRRLVRNATIKGGPYAAGMASSSSERIRVRCGGIQRGIQRMLLLLLLLLLLLCVKVV